MGRALLVVDPQHDFIEGSLPVPGATDAMDNLASQLASSQYTLKIVTLDWHPWTHMSFAANGGQWPAHCVAYSLGATVWPSLQTALHQSRGKVEYLVKGETADKEEYSIFANPESSNALQSAISDCGITGMDICGIAGDICVLNTLRDGVAIYGKDFFTVLPDFSPSLDAGQALASFCARESLCVR